jgi:hypothetical protein
MNKELFAILADSLNEDVTRLIAQFVGYPKKKKTKHSPNLQKELTKLQASPKFGTNEMYLRDLDEFILK